MILNELFQISGLYFSYLENRNDIGFSVFLWGLIEEVLCLFMTIVFLQAVAA